MTDPGGTPTAGHWAPIWRFACRKARECVRLTGKVRELEAALAVANAERDALTSRWALAVRQREDARDFAAGVDESAEPWPAWDEEGFERFLRSLGDRPA